MVEQTPKNQADRGGEMLNRLPVNLHMLLNETHQWLPQLKRKDLWRPLAAALLALNMGACNPVVGFEKQNPPSPPAVTETYQPPLPTPQLSETPTPTPEPTPTPTPTPTSTPTPTPTSTPTPSPTFHPTPSEFTFPQPTEVVTDGEIILNDQLIALSDEKIKELLALPENKGKFICPINPDQNTKITVDAYGKRETDERGDAIIITNFLEDRPSERKLFFPSIDGGGLTRFSRVGTYVYFGFGDNIIIRISSPEQVGVGLNKKAEDFVFGDILATGYKNYNSSIFGEISVTIFRPAIKDGKQVGFYPTSPLMLKYKNRFVVRK